MCSVGMGCCELSAEEGWAVCCMAQASTERGPNINNMLTHDSQMECDDYILRPDKSSHLRPQTEHAARELNKIPHIYLFHKYINLSTNNHCDNAIIIKLVIDLFIEYVGH